MPALRAPLWVILWGMPDGPPPDGAVAYGCILPSDGALPTHVCRGCRWEGTPAGWADSGDAEEAEREADVARPMMGGTRKRERGSAMGDRVEYACERCGYRGSSPDEADVDRIQCPMCGEPVVPV